MRTAVASIDAQPSTTITVAVLDYLEMAAQSLVNTPF